MSSTESRREELVKLLGDLPDRSLPIKAKTLWSEERDRYYIEKLVLDLNQIEPVPAYFVRPLSDAGEKFPVILYNHAHGSNYPLGKDELLQGHGECLQSPPYAEELTCLGYAALCFDTWVFGERAKRKNVHKLEELAVFKEMLWRGQVMWGMMVYDSLRGIDYLLSRPDVDPSRLGTLGLSMGSTMAWWVAALDERVKVCIDICCLTDFDALIENDGLNFHSLYYFVPGLLKHFTAHEINALIAPRPHLGLAGDRDPLTPPKGLERIDAELKKVYAAAGAPDAWKLIRVDGEHAETPEMRSEIIAFLKKWM